MLYLSRSSWSSWIRDGIWGSEWLLEAFMTSRGSRTLSDSPWSSFYDLLKRTSTRFYDKISRKWWLSSDPLMILGGHHLDQDSQLRLRSWGWHLRWRSSYLSSLREQLKALWGLDSGLQIWGFLSRKHRGRTSPTGVPTNFSKSILDEIEDEIIAGD